ncbi:MAG TPA: SMI1/KNR4 family protein [Chitinophagaceae bacterium]
MRKLTVVPRIGDKSFQIIEDIVGSKFSDNFKAIMKGYAGLNVFENIYRDRDNNIWALGSFDNFTSIYELTKEFIQNYKRKLIPFAYDPGGWHFCLCMDEGVDYGKIIINRWTDHLPKEQFLIIADSFEEFINGLKREDEIGK